MKIHIGCGKRNFGSEWIHIDGEKFQHVDSHDIFLSCIDDNCVNLIYSAHMLEYFNEGEAIDLLGHWFAKLKPGGKLRLAVPDFEVMARLYLHEVTLRKIIGPLYGEMKMGDKTIYHKTAYDFLSLCKLLKLIGFKNMARYDWRTTEHSHIDDHSQAYLPHMDKENGTLISLNVECIK
jgi:predicted SAM-dependent methyltransferase